MNYENVTCATKKQGAHNMPCKRCGEVNWKQNKVAVAAGYPLFDCETKDCDGVLWSD